MDELTVFLSSSVRVSTEEDDIFLIHPRYVLYKAKNTKSSQEERRRRWLECQKEKRTEKLNIHRGISGKYKEVLQKMELEVSSKQNHKKVFIRNQSYKDWIMLSEWLVDVPNNLKDDWYCTICPEGKRVLVVAERGSTCAYSRKGAFVMRFPSVLPGGCSESIRGYTVVDCIWHYPTKTFYLLDVLIWGIPLTNCEAELRFFWLSSKVSELPGLMEYSQKNRHRFVLLQHNPTSQLHKMLSVHPAFTNNFPKVDGILFFHKDCLYTGGKSPLVTWLKPFMVPDILDIQVDDQYILEKPPNYPEKPVTMEIETSKTWLNNEEIKSQLVPETSISLET